MSWVSDSTPLVAGAWLSSAYVGHGITGADMRATTGTGTHGPGYLYNDWDSSADDAKEFRGLLLSVPAAGTFAAWEDGSFTLSGAPDGVYTFDYRLFVDGADLGVATVTITIGAAGASVSHSATLAAVSSSMAAQVQLQVSASQLLDAVTGTMAVQIELGVSMAAQLGAVQSTMLLGSAGAVDLAMSAQLAPITSSMALNVAMALELSSSATLGPVLSGMALNVGALPTAEWVSEVLPRLPRQLEIPPIFGAPAVLRFSDKAPSDRVPLAFNFSRDMDEVQSSPAPTVTITRAGGAADANPSAMKDGDPIVQGTRVIQWVEGGTPGTRYTLTCSAYRADGALLSIEGELAVR